MGVKILFTGKPGSQVLYPNTDFEDNLKWLSLLDTIGFDVETNVTESILNRELKVMSISNEDGSVIWVIQTCVLNPVQLSRVLSHISNKLCIIHNASFDYQVMKKYNCTLEKVHCTMLAEEILNNGYSYENGYNSLAGVYQRRFNLDISKDEQTSFGSDEPLTVDQIRYAAIDVLKLGALRKIQLAEMKYEDSRIKQKGNKGLLKTMWWENEFVKVVGDMETSGVKIEKEPWYALEDALRPIWIRERDNLNNLVLERYKDILIANDWVSDEDEITVNIWTSTAKKQDILNRIFEVPLEKTSKVELKKYLREYDPDFPEGLALNGKKWDESEYPRQFKTKFALLKLLILGPTMHKNLDQFLMDNAKGYLHKKGWVRLANEVTLNWGSPTQRLKIFKAIDPAIDSTSKEVLIDFADKDVIIPTYMLWAEADYSLKSYGKSFYDNHVELDGRHRTRFRQILATGRMSSTKPNLLAIPKKKEFRDCFVASEDSVLIGADYDGEELLITATLAKEKSWLDSFTKGHDLHSINAKNTFGGKWLAKTKNDCAFEKYMLKCACPEHESMRDDGKTITFGSIYGLSALSLAARLKISTSVAQEMLDNFFKGIPNISKLLDNVKRFALTNGYIVEPVMGRIRYFDKWKLAVPKEQGGVERQAGNYIIQSSGGAILKIFAVLFRRFIRHNNLQDKIQLLLLVHDECLVNVHKDLVDTIKPIVAEKMMLAGKLAGFPLLKAESKSGLTWGSVH